MSGLFAATGPPALDAGDRAAIDAAVDGFVRKAVLPLVERPEVRLSSDVLAEIDRAAEAGGILPTHGAPGMALWEQATPAVVSLDILHRIARANAGIAFRFHLRALSALCAGVFALPNSDCMLSLHGAAPFGKGMLANHLRGLPVDGALLQDSMMAPGRELFAYGPADWSKVVGPVWENGISWRRWSRNNVAVHTEPEAHGLSEAVLYALSLQGEGEEILAGPHSLEVFLALVTANAMGCVAITVGAVEHAIEIAAGHAAVRRQGGTLLREHAAIRLLLGEATANAGAVRMMLAGMPVRQGTPAGFESVLQIRAVAQPLLCAAANHCLQILGGYGYLQDYGVEKIVRDCNALRLVGGTPTDLRLHLGASGGTA